MGLALLARTLKLVAGLPSDKLGLRCPCPSQRESEQRHNCVPREIHAGIVLVARLVVVLVGVLLSLLQAPFSVVVLVFHAFIERERRHPHPRERKMIGTIVVSGF